MPLSITKLEKLLAIKNFMPIKYFVIHGLCVYIELLSMSTADTFLLYIPSKYKFFADKNSDRNIFKIKYLEDIDDIDTKNTANAYAGEPNENDVENVYREVDSGMSPVVKGDNIGDHLEENYKKDIKLKDITTDDSKEVRDIIRQLNRLRFCVQNVRYKIAIQYDSYLCSIKRDDTIECYSIKRFTGKKLKKLYITVDLELFYEKIDSLTINMESVKSGIYHILDKNQFTHTKILQKLLEGKDDIVKFSENTYVKKIALEKYLKEAERMLEAINQSEKSTLEEMYEIAEKYKDPNMQRLHNDIDRTHKTSKLETKLKNIQKTKEDVVKTIFELKERRENTMLIVDKIMFDNSVMIDSIMRNFAKLGSIS